MKKLNLNYTLILCIVIAGILSINDSFSQNNGDLVFTGATSNDWSTATNWQKSDGAGGYQAWTQAVPARTDNVYIPSGKTVTLSASYSSCLSLTNNGTFSGNATGKKLVVGNSSSTSIFVNNGTMSSTNSISLQFYRTATKLTISGSASASNTNFAGIGSDGLSSYTNGSTQEIVIDMDLNVGNLGLEGYTATAGNTRKLTINSSKIVTVSGTFHYSNPTGGLVTASQTNDLENWVYNINGTVNASSAKIILVTNLSASVTTNKITVNVGATGSLICGSYVAIRQGNTSNTITINNAGKIEYTGTAYTDAKNADGATSLTATTSLLTLTNKDLTFSSASGASITSSGTPVITVSGTLTNTSKLTLNTVGLTLGSSATIASPSSSNYIVENGTGKLTLYCPASTATLFPVGVSATAYTPATITASANANISAAVSNAFTNAVNNASLANSTQWIITPDASVNATVALTPESNTINADPVIGYFSSGLWSEQAAAYSSGVFTANAAIATTANTSIYLGTGSATGFKIPAALSTDATLSDIKVDGTTITGYNPATHTYTYRLADRSSSTVPTITYTKSNENASVVFTNASAVPGAATIKVTAQDGNTVITYTVNVDYTYGTTATLSDLKIDNVTVTGFSSATTSYMVYTSSATVPVVTAIATDSYAKSVVITPPSSLPGTTNIVVTADDNTTTKTYTINFRSPVNLSAETAVALNAYNQNIKTNGVITVASDGTINSTNNNAYIEIPVKALTTGTYYAKLDLSNQAGAASNVNVDLYQDGSTFSLNSARTTAIPATGSWSTFKTYYWNAFSLTANTNYILRITFKASSGWVANINTITVGNAKAIPALSSGGTISTSGISAADLANGDITVSSGELIVDQNSTMYNVNLQPGAKLTLNTGSTLNANKITLNSDASGTATFVNNGTINITSASVQQYLPDARNWYVSSPVSKAAAPSGFTYYSYDETGQNPSPVAPATAYWVSVAPGADLNKGVGYIALPSATGSTITFTTKTGETLNSGDVDITLTRSGATKTGFNLIGNPYPAHLTWTKTFVDNNAAKIEPTIWYRTNAGTVNSGGDAAWSFKTINASTGEASPLGTTNIIPPAQAFWVRAVAAGTLTLNSDLTKSHQTSNPLKAPAAKNTDRQRVRLQVSNGTSTDEALIYFDADALNGYDNFDSPKMSNNSASVTEIYTQVNGQKLVINGMNSIADNLEIPLGFTTGQSNTFTLKATQLSNIGADTQVYLKDNTQVNSLTELVVDQDYTFTSDVTTDNTSRFSLVFKAPTTVTATDLIKNQLVRVFSNESNQIIIEQNVNVKNSVAYIYNAVGQLMQKLSLNSAITTSGVTYPYGTYFVTIRRNNTQTTSKLLINRI